MVKPRHPDPGSERIVRVKRAANRPRPWVAPPRILPIKPSADPSLAEVFARIGEPPAIPFRPDPFQLEALAATERADCLVTAPTGAGKTWIAEQSIAARFKKGQRAWYASPLKALTNSKYAEFSQTFGAENVGILTGDRKENAAAPIIVGTTEILRNQLYDAMSRGEDLSTDFVVLDEAHFLGDADRGVVWEEVMIYLPSRIPLLMLSATIGNAEEIAGWLSGVRLRPCMVVKETRRPVPLYPLFFHPSGRLHPLLSPDSTGRKPQLDRKVRAYLQDKNAPVLCKPQDLPPFGDMLHVLRTYRLLPAIFFLKSRADCDRALELCQTNRTLDPDKSERLNRRIEELAAANPYIARHRQLSLLQDCGVGAHHAGQLPAWKLLLETLMKEGLLDAIFATSTVAAGVNFPARSIVLLNSDRFDGEQFVPLDPTEFHQMTGRAGRRGMDRIGFAIIAPGKFMDIHRMGGLVTSPPSDVYSQIRVNFSMTLNLLLSHTPGQVETLLDRSFAAYTLGGQAAQHVRQYLMHDFARHLDFLIVQGFVTERGDLTPTGRWASQLRVDQPLLIAQGLLQDILPVNDPALLAAIVASFVNERETDEDLDEGKLPHKLVQAFMKVKRGLSPLIRQMKFHSFEVRPLCLRPATTMYAWASGQMWHKAIATSHLAEGDLVMLILRTADNLRHIETLDDVFPTVAQCARRAIEAIVRDPVIV